MAKNKKPQEILDLELKNKLIRDGAKSLEDYQKLLDKTREIDKNINFIKSQREKINKTLISQKAKLVNLSGVEEAKQNAEITKTKQQLNFLDDKILKGEKNLDIHKEAVNQVSKLALGFKSVKRQVVGLGKLLLQQKGYLLEQQKAVKETELQMGVLSNQANGFRNNIYKASLTTNKIGVGTKELAKIQGTYSDNIGRSVQLSEEQLIAMSELAKGTVLGVEGAAEFAAEMDKFGISAKGSAEFVDDLLKTSTKMGVSSGKVIKNVQQNIKLANKYTFKGGIKGLGKMATLATRFKIEMQDIANFAENLITPEGAVEAAAKLQVLGGAWAKLGDPFELMYRSRNDMVGLTEDIIKATTETARFDKATGEVTIDPMELHRLREVANATGISFDSLSNSAREAAKFTQIEGNISGIFDEEDKAYISSLAQFNKKSGQFEVTMQSKDGTVTESVNALKKITPEFLKSQREYQQTLKENAEQAMTFKETWDNIKNTLRSVILPGFEAFAGALNDGLGGFHDWAVKEGIFDKMADFGKWVGELAATVVKFMAKNPITSALTLGAGYLVGKAAMWIANGKFLRMGFNMGGPMGGFGGGGNATMKRHPKGTKVNGKNVGGQMYNAGKTTKGVGGLGKIGKLGKGLGKVAAPLAALAVAIDGFSNFNDESLSSGDAALKTLDQHKFMAMGAAIGSIVPGLGTIAGAGIGGIADWVSQSGGEGSGLLGDYGKGNGNRYEDDFISRPNQDSISFNSQDTLIGAKPNGPIDKLLNFNGIANPSKNNESMDTSLLINAIEKDKTVQQFSEGKRMATPSKNYLSMDDSFLPLINAIEKGKTVENYTETKEIATPSKNSLLTDSPFSSLINSIKKGKTVDNYTETKGIATPGKNNESIDSSLLINAIEKGKNIEKYSSKEKVVSTSGNKVSVEFGKPLTIEGKLEITSGDSNAKIDLNDPFLMRELSRTIQEQLTSAISGGKISSNPVIA
tara:strand:+ start:17995 stop:20922 length:2928 start_codon:yes stop_codon:yes gene_type:complete